MQTKSNWRSFANIGKVLTFRDADKSPAAGASIWESCNQLAMLDPALAISFFDDFLNLPMDDTTGNPVAWRWASDTATGGITLAKLAGGVVNVACGGVDNNESYIQAGGLGSATNAPFDITDVSGKPLWFEARVKAVEVADVGIFVGLAEEGASAANFLTDNSGVVADKDAIGFKILTASPAAWDTHWKKAGQVLGGAAAVAVNAGDWHTFGFVFDGVSTVTFHVDRVAHATVATTSAATFPSAQLMAPIIAIKTGEGTAKSVQVDYIKVVQVR